MVQQLCPLHSASIRSNNTFAVELDQHCYLIPAQSQFLLDQLLLTNNRCPVGRSIDITPVVGRPQLPVKFGESPKGDAADERHTFHIFQRLLDGKDVSIIEDDCPNRTLLRKTLYGARFGSTMHESDNTRIDVHNQVYSCTLDRMKPEAEADQIALKEERQQYILELLGSEGRVLAADLSSRYRVSEDTIRRDLRELASSGKIQRVHGGALARRAQALPFESRQQVDMESKLGIARTAAAMIRDGQVVLIDGGTTNLRIASYLSRERSATIVTNSPPLALELADHPKLSVLMLGGNFLKEERVTTGIETIRQVESIRADLCFLGMCSLHPEVGITVGNREEAYVKQAMMGASTEVVGLISLGKMGTSLPYLVGPASRLTRLITDASDEDVLNPYRSRGIEVTST
jgi:DeoR/GlpR family transcriptional regulator of sugar metabolism